VLRFIYFHAECHYAECRYAECLYAKCHVAAWAPDLLKKIYLVKSHKIANNASITPPREIMRTFLGSLEF